MNIPPPTGLNGIAGFDPVTSHLPTVEFQTILYCPSEVDHVVLPFLAPLQLNCNGPYAVAVLIAIKHNFGQTADGVIVGVVVGLDVIVGVGGNKLQIVDAV
jgi:hypothetical protein